MRDQTRRVLELFVEKADLLQKGNFAKLIAEYGVSYSLAVTVGKPVETHLTVPDDDALAAFIMTLRMFIQQRDSFALKNLVKLMADPDLSENWKAQVSKVQGVIAATQARPPDIAIEFNGTRPTAGRILEVFLYGDIAHTNDEERCQFLEWKQNPLFFELLQYAFHDTLTFLLKGIDYISQVTKLELAGFPVPRLPTQEEREQSEAQRGTD